MNSRSIPWRTKPTQDIQDTIQEAQQLRLYLIQEIGPTSFVFKDDDENKFKVSIGSVLSCTCSPHKRDHCTHTLYVFLKIYKISPENSLIWQASYLDSEVSDLIRNRFNPQSNQRPKKVEKFLKKSAAPKLVGGPSINRQAFGDEDICPICHEDMKEEEGTTYCKKGCGNNFHFKCVMIWAEHRHKVDDAISCPLCRCDWGNRAYEALQKDFQEFQSRLIIHKGHKCHACKGNVQKSVRGKLYHCMYCENYELCEKCYSNFEHFEHNRFLVKETIRDDWKPAQGRDTSLINPYQMKDDTGFWQNLAQFGIQSNSPAYFNLYQNNASEQRKNFVRSENMTDEEAMKAFLVSCFPEMGIDTNPTQPGKSNKLSVVGHDVKKNCSHCHTDSNNISKLRRLFCSHVIHEHCLLEMLANKSLKCPDDGSDLLQGYKTAFGVKELPVDPTPKQDQKKLIIPTKSKKVLEENKSARNDGLKPKKLDPLGLDIKGKSLISGENDGDGDVITSEIYNPLSIQKKSTSSTVAGKRPPMASKSKGRVATTSASLPPIMEIQGMNFSNNEQSSRNNSKPLMPIQNKMMNISNEQEKPLKKTPPNNFRISSSSIKVQPRVPKKTVNKRGAASNQEQAPSMPYMSNQLIFVPVEYSRVSEVPECDENTMRESND